MTNHPGGRAVESTAALDSLHHRSHVNLLTEVHDVVVGGDSPRLDAIIVPAFRRLSNLEHVLAVAGHLGCQLLVLCSGSVRAADVTRLGDTDRVLAIDVPGLAERFPPFATTELVADTVFDRQTDISLKRNVGLAVAWAEGWRRIAFLDDDIEVLDPRHLTGAAELAGRFDAVGLENVGYPDNSVVCHALRQIDVRQRCFIGGGAMVIDTGRMSFFPHIYNEDWFFLLRDRRLGPVGLLHRSVTQAAFDPFNNPWRAAEEELGDCLAEGVFWLLDEGGDVDDADAAYWASFLVRREDLTRAISARLLMAPIGRECKTSILAALAAARHRRRLIEPAFCVAYLEAWRKDRDMWAAEADGPVRMWGRRALATAAA